MHRKFLVRDWMNDLVVFVDPGHSVSEALSMMRRRYINSVIVKKTEASPDYGIVTSHDISNKIVAENRNPRETKIKEIMTSPVLSVDQTATIMECALLMKENMIHHLPVHNDQGEIIGMISASDFLVIAEGMGNNFEDRSLT